MPPKKGKRKQKTGYTDIANQGSKTSLYANEKEEVNNSEFFYTIKQPSFIRTFMAILKKNFLVRRRTSSSFMVYFLMPFLILPITEIDWGNSASMKDITYPEYENFNDVYANISAELRKNSTQILAAAPSTPQVKKIMTRFNAPNLLKVRIFNSSKTLVKAMYKNKGGVGFYFWNSNESDFLLHPHISIASKDFSETGRASLYVAAQDALLNYGNKTMNYKLQHRNYAGHYGHYMFNTDILVSSFIMIPIISLLSKEAGFLAYDVANKVNSLLMLSGCYELAYWLATIVTSLICCVPTCLIISYYFTSESLLVDTDFSLIFVFFVLFCTAQGFAVYLSSLWTGDRTGKGVKAPMTLISLVISLLSGRLSGMESEILFLITSLIFPQISYSQGLHSILQQYRSTGPVKWHALAKGNNFIMRRSVINLALSGIFYCIVFCLTVIFSSTGFSIKRLKASLKRYTREYFSGDNAVIEARDLRKSYDDLKALDGVDFVLENGDIVALIGPNGSGKSTLINTMTRTIQPDSGHLTLFQHEDPDPFVGFEELKRCTGVCFQSNSLVPELTIREHLTLFATVRGMSQEQIIERTSTILSQLNLDSSADTQSENLSGGQKRKLCIAIALLARPPIVILDEPTSGVDFEARQNIWKVLSSQSQCVTFITSHALEEAEDVCNKIFIMQKGKITFKGSSTELRQKFDCGYLLRVIAEKFDSQGFLALLRQTVPTARLLTGKTTSFVIPSGIMNVSDLLRSVEENKEKYGVQQYTFTVEALEEVLLRIVEEGDAIAPPTNKK